MASPPLNPNERVRGVVFDLDGTLVDGYDGIAAAVNAARAAFGLPAMTTDDVRGRVGLGLSHLMEDVCGPERALLGATIFRGVYDRVGVEQTRPVAALGATLAALRARGFRLSVANDEALYVGDMTLDAESGARADVPVVLVCGGSSSREALVRTGQPVIEALSDLLDVLPRHAPSGERGS